VDSTGHGEVVLRGILAGGGSAAALDYAQLHLREEHFEDTRQRSLFTLCVRYMRQTRGILTRDALDDLLRRHRPGSRLSLITYYDVLARARPKGHEFKHSVDQLRELAAERATKDAYATALGIITSPDGWEDENGAVLKGDEDSRAWLLSQLAAIDRDTHLAESPEGDAHDEADDVMAAYARAKALHLSGQAPGVLFGIDELDAMIDGGVGPGEMCLIRAGTTIGKSRLCVQWAWHASAIQSKHVIYFTTETLKPQICNNLVARHSAYLGPQYGFPRGLNARKIRAGRLTDPEEDFLAIVLKDWKDEAGRYGRCRVVQMPEHCTMSVLAARYAAIGRQFTPQLCIADYLQLFEPDKRGRDSREHENMSGILKTAERWCGAVEVPFVTPWQVNRGGRANLKANGKYTLEDSAGSQEASNTPDIVLDLLDREEDTSSGREAPLDLIVMKMRDGPRGQVVPLVADYATCLFAAREAADESLLELEMSDAQA
jgi:replicative DNA helicase